MTLLPGITAVATSTEAITGIRSYIGEPIPNAVIIGSAAVDAGSTPTTTLRPGLVLGKKTSDGYYYQHNPTATDGTQYAVAVLRVGISTLDPTGTAVAKQASVYDGGRLQAASLISGTQSGALTPLARRQMEASGKFEFDDDPNSAYKGLAMSAGYETVKTAAYSIVSGDTGTIFDTTGATASVTLTLPAIVAGLEYGVRVGADQVVIVASAEGSNIVAKNNLTASNLAYSTSSQKIGGTLNIKSNMAGTKWLATNLSGDIALSVY